MPQFDIDGRLIGVEQTGIYEEMERIGGLAPACQLTQLPFAQMDAFLKLTGALAQSPLLTLYLEAYRLTKAHVSQRLADRVGQTGKDVFAAFEGALLRNALVDKPSLHDSLSQLMQRYDQRWPQWDTAEAT